MSKSIRSSIWLRGLLLIAASGAFACGKDHDPDRVTNPADPGSSGTLAPTPVNVSAILGNRSVQLTWALGDSSLVASVDRYRVYRVDGGVRQLADSTTAPPIFITGLDNGAAYRFQVTSVLDSGLESRPSNTITAAPATFGVIIESGREATNSTRVVLAYQAPSSTQGVRVANQPDLSTTPIQPFTGSQIWNLEPGDGPKTVWVQFTDAFGNQSETVFDQIDLDTRAQITEVSFTPNVAAPGDVLYLRLDADETEGTATARLGEAGRFVTLRDDGLDGDPVAGDGVYERAYVIEQDVELFEELVTGNFTDKAGNRAEPRYAPGRLTVHLDPEPVVLYPPTSPGPQEIELRWSQAPDGVRFHAYRVYRDDAPGVANSPTRRLVHEQLSRSLTTFTDTGLDPTKTYYYIVEVVDELGNGAPSNEVSARTRENEPPEPVLVETPSEVTESSITISYSRNYDDDFAEYRIWRGLQPNLDTDPERRQVASLRDADQTRFTDRQEIEENRTYYYRVDVVDQLGASSPSNVVNATTPDRLPPAVNLDEPTSVGETTVLLEWTQTPILDFERYDLRRADTPGVTGSAPLVVSISDDAATSHLDTGRRENTDYYYRVFVVDRGGNATGSNEIEVTTRNADPPAVTLAAPTEQPGAPTPSVILAWSQSAAHDFQSYRVFRDLAPAVSQSSTLVRAIFQATTTSFTDQGLEDNQRYYYRVFVDDNAGGVTGSNEQSVVTANRAPTPVVLSVSGTGPNSISLSWTQNLDHDFDQYRLLQGLSASSFPIVAAEFDHPEQTSHTVYVADDAEYFFKLVVYDQDIDSSQRLTSDSNIVSAQAAPGAN